MEWNGRRRIEAKRSETNQLDRWNVSGRLTTRVSCAADWRTGGQQQRRGEECAASAGTQQEAVQRRALQYSHVPACKRGVQHARLASPRLVSSRLLYSSPARRALARERCGATRCTPCKRGAAARDHFTLLLIRYRTTCVYERVRSSRRSEATTRRDTMERSDARLTALDSTRLGWLLTSLHSTPLHSTPLHWTLGRRGATRSCATRHKGVKCVRRAARRGTS